MQKTFLFAIIVLFSSCFSASKTTKINLTQSVGDSTFRFKADTSKRAFPIVGEIYGHKVMVLEDTFVHENHDTDFGRRSTGISTYFITDSTYTLISGQNRTIIDSACENPIIIQQAIKFYVNGQKTNEYVYDPPTIKIQLSNNKIVDANLINISSMGIIEDNSGFVWRISGGNVRYPNFQQLYDMDGKKLYSKLTRTHHNPYNWRIMKYLYQNYEIVGSPSYISDCVKKNCSLDILYELSGCAHYVMTQ